MEHKFCHVPDETGIHFHAAIMVERAGDSVVPEMNVSGSGLYTLVGFLYGGHDHGLEMFWGQDYYVVVVVLSLIVICSSRQKVSFLVGSASFMMEGEMIFCQLDDPSGLSSVYFLGLSEILEVLVIHPNFKVLVCSHEVVSPFFESEHDHEEFFVIDLIVTFHN